MQRKKFDALCTSIDTGLEAEFQSTSKVTCLKPLEAADKTASGNTKASMIPISFINLA
jgi:hypothetical protein